MKLDIYSKQWLDIVFQYRNKNYGAYDLRKSSTRTLIKSLIISVIGFSFAVSTPFWIKSMPNTNEDVITSCPLTPVDFDKPKEVETKKNVLPPPPKSKFNRERFVKPLASISDEVEEEIIAVEDLKGKVTGAETIKGDINTEYDTFDLPEGDGNSSDITEYTGPIDVKDIQVKPLFPGGMEKFYEFIGRNYVTPEDCTGGRLIVTFVVEKDGSISGIRVLRDIGFGAGNEAVRVLSKSPKWIPGEQSGAKVRVQYSLPISIQSAE